MRRREQTHGRLRGTNELQGHTAHTIVTTHKNPFRGVVSQVEKVEYCQCTCLTTIRTVEHRVHDAREENKQQEMQSEL